MCHFYIDYKWISTLDKRIIAYKKYCSCGNMGYKLVD